jgi:hypothetical protein
LTSRRSTIGSRRSRATPGDRRSTGDPDRPLAVRDARGRRQRPGARLVVRRARRLPLDLWRGRGELPHPRRLPGRRGRRPRPAPHRQRCRAPGRRTGDDGHRRPGRRPGPGGGGGPRRTGAARPSRASSPRPRPRSRP